MGVQVFEQILLIHSAEYHSQYFQIYLKEKLLQRCEGTFSFVVKDCFLNCKNVCLIEEEKKKPKWNHRWSEKILLFVLSSLLVLNFCPCLMMLAVAHSGINYSLCQRSTLIDVDVFRAVSKFSQCMLQSMISNFSHFHTFHQHLTSTNFAMLQGKNSLLVMCFSICDL